MYLPENGLKDLEDFGQKHVELEANHSQFSWFNDKVCLLEILKLQLNKENVVLKLPMRSINGKYLSIVA